MNTTAPPDATQTDGSPPGARVQPSSVASRTGVGVALTGILLLSLVLAAALGDSVRSAGLIITATDADSTSLEFADAPEEARAFFRSRDRLVIRVPRSMTRSEFITMYHLENAQGATEALDRLGARAPLDLLNEGDTVSIPLLIPEVLP